MSHGEMLPGQLSLWHLESVQDGPRNLVWLNRVSNSWDIADIEFSGGGGGGAPPVVGVGVRVKYHFHVKPNLGC